MKRRIMQHFIRVFTYLSLLGKMDLQKKKYNFLEIIICDPSIYTIDHPDLTISNFMRNFIGTQKVYLFVLISVSRKEERLQEQGMIF